MSALSFESIVINGIEDFTVRLGLIILYEFSLDSSFLFSSASVSTFSFWLLMYAGGASSITISLFRRRAVAAHSVTATFAKSTLE